MIPSMAKDVILTQLHDGVTGGHLGIKKTLSKIQQRLFWYNLKKDVESCAATVVSVEAGSRYPRNGRHNFSNICRRTF